MTLPVTLLAWSSGKDCAWALHALRRSTSVVGLLCTINEAFDRVSMHGTRREVVEAQARSAGLDLWQVPVPWPCTNDEYDRRMAEAMVLARARGIEQIAFGDLFLEDVRRYREERLAPTGMRPVFPLWTSPERTADLAAAMLDAGLRARVATVDTRRLDASLAGREYDERFLALLPAGVDPCGENGEFHTVCFAGPMFASPIRLEPAGVVVRDGFAYADLALGRC